MRYVRFISRAFVGGRIYEAGDEGLVDDNVFGAHVIDVASGEPTHHLIAGHRHEPAFLDHTSDAPHPSGVGMIQSSSVEVTPTAHPTVAEEVEKDG